MKRILLFPSGIRRGAFMAAFALAMGTIAACLADDNVIPLIVMDKVPLCDAIKNLARQAELNYILDPRLAAASEPDVTVRWENLSAEKALGRLLEERSIRLVEDPRASIVRITRSKEAPRPTGITLRGGDTNEMVPLLVMDEVPLTDALQVLARQAKLDVKLSPELSAPAARNVSVSLRWRNVSARQALAALLNNYELVAVTNSAPAGTSMTIKPFSSTTSTIPEKERGAEK